MAEFTTVFLSSTAKDLDPWRDAVYAALNKMRGVHCERMEDFGAIDAAPAEACRRRVGECEVFVGLVGHFFGSAPDGSVRSYTQIEYDEAVRLEKPRLIFLADDDFPLSPRLGRESEEKYLSQVAFREEVGRERVVVRFHDPDRLATDVATSLGNLLQDLAARLTPVEKQVVRAAVPPGPDEAVLRRAYLGRLIGKLENLVLSGVDPAVKDGQHDPRMKLRAIYTALRTGLWFLVRRTIERRSGSKVIETSRLLSALEVLDREKRMVLLGGPGSGKSTFVSFVALCLAGELGGHTELNLEALNDAEKVLEEQDEVGWKFEDEAESEDPDGQETAEGDEETLPDRWHHGPLLPVRIVLRDFAARGEFPPPGERATARCLSDFLVRELTEDFDLPAFAPVLERELLAGRCLVLLDGLDEVPEAGERREQIVQAVQAWTDGLGESRVLVTSRTYAYQSQAWKLDGFSEAGLEPFDEAQIGHFVGLWYGQMVALGRCQKEEAANRSDQLREAISGSSRLLDLARQPLLLTLTASLHAWRRGELPRRREALYRESVDLLLENWERRQKEDERGRPLAVLQPSLAEWLQVDPREVRDALNELAFQAHSEQEDQEGMADLSGDRVVARLRRLNPQLAVNTEQLLAYLRDRAGILVERGNDLFTFPHRTFQEYLAACHLKQKFQPADIADLARSDPRRWREVLLLAAGESTAAASWVWDLAEDLCPLDEDGAAIGEEDRWGALFSAQVVVESADRRWLEEPRAEVEDGVGSGKIGKAHQKRVARLRDWLEHLKRRAVEVMRAGDFPVRERALAGKLLAELGDPRFDPNHWFLPKELGLGFLEVPAGKFWMGSDKGERGSYDDERPRHEVELPAFWLARFPVTVGQLGVFVAASGREMPDESWKQAPSNHPVAYVDWNDALAYCDWLGARLREIAPQAVGREGASRELWAGIASGDLRATLPSEAEWEKAARGAERRIYPWGSEEDPNRANYYETGLGERSSVGCFPGGIGSSGHEEMSGNVWGWTRSLWRAGKGGKEDKSGYPYVADDGREDLNAPGGLRVVRGGAFYSSSKRVRCASRHSNALDYRNVTLGFRVVLAPFPL